MGGIALLGARDLLTGDISGYGLGNVPAGDSGQRCPGAGFGAIRIDYRA